MGRRASEANQDSLDLLLDTICNMFGGIVFIALLVMMMIQPAKEEQAESEEPVSEADLQELADDVELSQTQLARLDAAHRQRLQILKDHIPDNLQSRIGELEDLASSREALGREAQQLRKKNTERLIEINRQKKEAADLDSQVAQARDELARLKAEYTAEAKDREIRLPFTKKSGQKLGLQVNLRYGRLYFRHDLSRLVRNERYPNTEHYIILSETSDDFEVIPDPTAGLGLKDDRLSTDFAKAIRSFNPSKWHLDVTVWPDSYGEFKYFREAAAEHGYRYTLVMVKDGLADRGGDTRRDQ